jgi:small subunit ribosomal protein S4e
MDVVEIAGLKKAYRVIPVAGKGLALVEAGRDTRGFKICKIDDKRTVSHGHLQICLHDGKNVLLQVQNPTNPSEDVYSTGSSLQMEIPSQKIVKQLKMTEGAYALVTAGTNLGRHGSISRIEQGTATRPGIVDIKDNKGETFRTISDYVFVVGEGNPVIELSGV